MRVRGSGRAGQKIVIAPPKTLDDTGWGRSPQQEKTSFPLLGYVFPLYRVYTSLASQLRVPGLPDCYLLCLPSLEAIWILGRCQKAIGPRYLKTFV